MTSAFDKDTIELRQAIADLVDTFTGHNHDGTDSVALATTDITDVTATAAELNINDVSLARADGLGGMFVYSATFDATVAANRTVGAHALGVSVPANMLVVGGCVDVLKTFTDGASDTATIAIKVVGENDIVSAIAIADSGNPWDQGRHDIIPDGTGSSFVKTTAASAITATVGTAALTAGTFVVHLFCIKATADTA